MKDRFGRNIDYIRFSITDRCNLRCRYCMPEGVKLEQHENMLTYEEFLRIADAAVQLGITRFKITGGEPLVRQECADFIARLKAMPGVEQVTLTTNGVLLAPLASRLAALRLDGVNISLDANDPEDFTAITGFDAYVQVMQGLEASLAAGLKTKLNCVLLPGCEHRLLPLAQFAQNRPVDVRFIEVMPIGQGAHSLGPDRDAVLRVLKERWPDLHPVEEIRSNGPAHYYAAAGLTGRIGLIDAVSHKFCEHCNRVRLTSTGLLKPCLCYGEGIDLRTLLRSDENNQEDLVDVLRQAIWNKPRTHCFDDVAAITEQKTMSEIGG